MSHYKGAVHDYTRHMLGGGVVPTWSNPTTAGGAEALLVSDPERVLVHISNLSANDIYMGFDQDVGSSNGMLISGNGGYRTLLLTEDFNLVGWPIWIYSALAGNQLYVLQQRRLHAEKVE